MDISKLFKTFKDLANDFGTEETILKSNETRSKLRYEILAILVSLLNNGPCKFRAERLYDLASVMSNRTTMFECNF